MAEVIYRPARVVGSVRIPPSKSAAHRALLCAALGKAPCTVSPIDTSADMYATLAGIRAMGVQADFTDGVVKRLHSNSKIIITTIQKLNAAVSKQWYSSSIEEIRHSRIVMIFDECHRSHFGECHKNIVKFFDNTQMFGFTGTPIFVENAVDGHTTKEIFGNCLHKYLIKDAIADENVLGFLVEYYHGNEDVDNADQDRMTEIAKFILNNFNKSTFDGEFDALFAVQSVPMLIRYYKIFKSLNPKIRIGAVFTYAANSSQDDEQTGMNTGGFASDSTGDADELQAIMDDYNDMYGTSFTTENFRAYYDDINLRMKKKKADMKPLDLCLVVGMFLTGFDSKKLNTLYVDKGVPYVATHPDVRCPIEGGEFIPDTGAMLELIKTATGKAPQLIFGKPYQYMVDVVLDKTGFAKDEIAMVGDRLATDIAFGLNNDILSIMVLTGEASMEDVEKGKIKPDIILPHAKEILNYI